MNIGDKKMFRVDIPVDLAEEIKKILSSRLGYMSVSEYVRDAIRDKLQRDKYQLEREAVKQRMEADYGEG